MSALHPENGLKLSIMGNTNPGLVQTDLSKAALTLTYAPGIPERLGVVVSGASGVLLIALAIRRAVSGSGRPSSGG